MFGIFKGRGRKLDQIIAILPAGEIVISNSYGGISSLENSCKTPYDIRKIVVQ